MRDEKIYATALIVGSVSSVGMMAFHPTGHDLFTAHFSSFMKWVHVVGLTNIGLLLFGFIGLSRQLGTARIDVTAAMAAYAIALAAVATPVAVSAFLMPSLEARMLAANADTAKTAMLSNSFMFSGLMINAFVKVFVLAASVAMFFWSLAMVRTARFPKAPKAPKALAWWGMVAAVLTVVAVLAEHLKLDVHGFAAVMFAQGVWNCWTAVVMARARGMGR